MGVYESEAYASASSGGSGSAAWGAITGTLSDQSDLQSALNSKQALDGDLTAIAALVGSGLLRRTGVDTWDLVANTGLVYYVESEKLTTPYTSTTAVQAFTATNATATRIDAAIVPKGDGGITTSVADNTAVGGNITGTKSISLITGRTAATQGATGQASIAIGEAATASGNQAIATGLTASATGTNCVAVGTTAVASSGEAIAVGNSSSAGLRGTAIGSGATVNQDGAVALGKSASCTGQFGLALGNASLCDGASSFSVLSGRIFGRSGVFAYAPSFEQTAGDSQILQTVHRNRTTDATPTLLTSDSSTTASASNIFILQNYSVQSVKLRLTAIQQSTSNVSVWDFDFVVARGANAAATTVKTGVIITTLCNDLAITPTSAWIVANTTLGGAAIQVTGLAATNIQWVAGVLNITENKY